MVYESAESSGNYRFPPINLVAAARKSTQKHRKQLLSSRRLKSAVRAAEAPPHTRCAACASAAAALASAARIASTAAAPARALRKAYKTPVIAAGWETDGIDQSARHKPLNATTLLQAPPAACSRAATAAPRPASLNAPTPGQTCLVLDGGRAFQPVVAPLPPLARSRAAPPKHWRGTCREGWGNATAAGRLLSGGGSGGRRGRLDGPGARALPAKPASRLAPQNWRARVCGRGLHSLTCPPGGAPPRPASGGRAARPPLCEAACGRFYW